MTSSDFLIRGLIKALDARFVFAETTKMVTRGILLHDTDPVASYVFGEALTVTALTAPLLDGEEKYSFRWEYEGAISTILTDVNAMCDVRGLMKAPHIAEVVSGEGDIYGDNGNISLVKSSCGQILNSGSSLAGLLDVVDDAGFFFSTSDQIETEFSVAVDFNASPDAPVKIAAGFMLQAMPECDLEKLERVRNRMNAPAFREILASKKMPEEKKLWKLLEELMGNEMNYSALEKDLGVSYEFGYSPSFTCSCSYDKMKCSLLVLSKDDLIALFQEVPEVKVECQFCKHEYAFKKEDVISLKK